MNGKDRLTYDRLIRHLSEVKIVACTQIAAWRAIQTSMVGSGPTSGPAPLQVKAFADSILVDAPANLVVMEQLVSSHGIKAVVADNPEYCLTEGDVAAGRVLLVCLPGEQNKDGSSSLGRWVLKSADGSIEGDGCGFALVGRLTGKSVADLRKCTAAAVLANHGGFADVLQRQEWLRMRAPKDAPSRLHTIWLSGGPEREVRGGVDSEGGQSSV